MNTNLNDNHELVTLLKRSNELLTVIAKAQLSDVMREIQSDPKHTKLYESTGDIVVKELAKKLSMSTGAISKLWQKWEDTGLIVKDGKSYRRLF